MYFNVIFILNFLNLIYCKSIKNDERQDGEVNVQIDLKDVAVLAIIGNDDYMVSFITFLENTEGGGGVENNEII